MDYRMRIMTVSRLVFLFIWPGLCVTQTFSNKSLLPSLIRHLDVHHVTFLKPDEDAKNLDFVQLYKSLLDTTPWLYISMLSYSDITSMIAVELKRSITSLIVLYENETIFNRLDLIGISLQDNISPFKWILITDNYNPENYKELNIPYNCEFLIAIGSDDAGYDIIEVYDALNVKKISNFLGKWSPNHGLEMENSGFFQRRGNLQGALFNISTNQENPCSAQSFESSPGSVLMCIHFHFFNLLSERNNFSINWLPQKADAYASTFYPEYLSDDIQFTLFEVNLNPKEGTTVIWPTTATPIGVYTSYTGRAFGWSTYIYPFSKQMWYAVFIWFLLSAAITSVAEFLTLKKKRKRFCVKIWLKYIFVAFSAFCYQTEGAEPERMSLRILLFLIFLIPTALMPGYSAALTSYLAVKVEEAPFTNLEELSRAKDYKLGHLASFNLSLFLDKNSEDEITRALYRDIILPWDQMPHRESEGIYRMCKEKFSYVCTMYTVVAVPPPCSYFSLDRPLVNALSMLPIKSNNPFKGLINRSLRIIHYSGIFFVIALRVLPGAVTYPTSDQDEVKLEAIQFENIIAIIVVLGFGILLSFLLLLVEFVFFRRRPANFNKAVHHNLQNRTFLTGTTGYGIGNSLGRLYTGTANQQHKAR